jgi:hypothetical protein
MRKLRPGANYVYNTRNGVTYAREAESLDEEAIGWDYDPRTEDSKPLIDHLMDNKLWGDIRRKADEDPQLRELLERAKIYYTLKYRDAE